MIKTNIWVTGKTTIFIGGDPSKGVKPEITIELTDPQVLFDREKNQIVILETK